MVGYKINTKTVQKICLIQELQLADFKVTSSPNSFVTLLRLSLDKNLCLNLNRVQIGRYVYKISTKTLQEICLQLEKFMAALTPLLDYYG